MDDQFNRRDKNKDQMSDELIAKLERRKVELDRMMQNLRETIYNSQLSLESMRDEKRALIDRIAKLKGKPKPLPLK